MYTIQVACICQVLEQSGDMARLSQFIDQLDNTSGGSSNSSSGVAHCTPSPLDSTNLGLSNIGHNYRVSQGREMGHDATIDLRAEKQEDIWVGGECQTVINANMNWID